MSMNMSVHIPVRHSRGAPGGRPDRSRPWGWLTWGRPGRGSPGGGARPARAARSSRARGRAPRAPLVAQRPVARCRGAAAASSAASAQRRRLGAI